MDVTDTRRCRGRRGHGDRLGGLTSSSTTRASRPQPAEDVLEDDFDRTLAVTKGTFFASQAAGRVMIEQGYGRIVNLGSQAGAGGAAGESVYCMTKAAIAI